MASTLRRVAGEAGLGPPAAPSARAEERARARRSYHGVVPTRVQVLGETELSYLDSLSGDARSSRPRGFFSWACRASSSRAHTSLPRALVAAAEATGTPALRDRRALQPHHQRAARGARRPPGAARRSLHGVLVDVFGVGLLLVGKSGIGKSECALELVLAAIAWSPTTSSSATGVRRGWSSARPAELLAPPHRGARPRRPQHASDSSASRPCASASASTSSCGSVEWNENEEYDRLGVEERFHVILGTPIRELARARASGARHGQRSSRWPRATSCCGAPARTRRASSSSASRRTWTTPASTPRRRARVGSMTPRAVDPTPGPRAAGQPDSWSTLMRPQSSEHRATRAPRGFRPSDRAAEERRMSGASRRPRPTVVVVTGLSGAGKSTALHALEDLGFFCVDNLPTVLAPQAVALCERGGMTRIALGIDVRVRAFLGEIGNVLARARGRGQRELEVLFLDASDETLLRRFSESRRPHPLRPRAGTRGRPRRARRRSHRARASRRRCARAPRASSTRRNSACTTAAQLIAHFGPASGGAPRMVTRIVSFGFKYGTPVDADVVLDVRFLDNPYFVPELKQLPGTGRAGRALRPRSPRDPGVPEADARASGLRDAEVRARGEELPDDRHRMHGRASPVRGDRRRSCARAFDHSRARRSRWSIATWTAATSRRPSAWSPPLRRRRLRPTTRTMSA